MNNIEKYLETNLKNIFDITEYDIITSTNTVLKQMASEGEREWKVLIANEQTEGKGRMNRKFYSPSKSGLYMSILLRPCIAPSETLFLTPMTAVAVSEAIESVFNVNTGIKWVNDIFLNDKKICGILAEASINETGERNEYVVIGIGINITNPENDFPNEIKEIAGSLINKDNQDTKNSKNIKKIDDIKNRLVAEILSKMYKYYKTEKIIYMNKYKEKSILMDRYIYMLSDESKEKWKVIDIDSSASLVVKNDEGIIKTISSGEVSVRVF